MGTGVRTFEGVISLLESGSFTEDDYVSSFAYLSRVRFELEQYCWDPKAVSGRVLAHCDNLLKVFPRYPISSLSGSHPLHKYILSLLLEIGYLILQAIRHQSCSGHHPLLSSLLDICELYSESAYDDVSLIAIAAISSYSKSDIAAALELACEIFDSTISSLLAKSSVDPTSSLISLIRSLRSLSLCCPEFTEFLRDSDVLTKLSTCFDVALPVVKYRFPAAPGDDVCLLRGEIIALSSKIIYDGCILPMRSCSDSSENSSERLAVLIPSIAFASDSVAIPADLMPLIGHGLLLTHLDFDIVAELTVFREKPHECGCELDESRLRYLQGIVESSHGSGRSARSTAILNTVKKIEEDVKEEKNEVASQLQEMFADYSLDYARACLAAFNFSFESTVEAIFDGKLPKHLLKVKNTKTWRDRNGGEEIRPVPKVQSQHVNKEDFEEYLKNSGRITIDIARSREEDRIKQEDDVLVPGLELSASLRQRMITDTECNYEDDEDDTFQQYERFDIGNVESDEDTSVTGKRLNVEQRSSKQNTSSVDEAASNPSKQIRDRSYKERNKGRFGNHDRKARANAKRGTLN
uniref:CUE domain-containing protein n=1 Tax=Spongospora subterranea TaxID=70186 RepID=A0A0H5R6Y1_9EUKA|eukprot:CRZ09885.1 hypothetical protein [Spongospora subterranea]